MEPLKKVIRIVLSGYQYKIDSSNYEDIIKITFINHPAIIEIEKYKSIIKVSITMGDGERRIFPTMDESEFKERFKKIVRNNINNSTI